MQNVVVTRVIQIAAVEERRVCACPCKVWLRLLVWMAHDKHLCQSVVLDLSSPLVIDEYLGGTRRAG